MGIFGGRRLPVNVNAGASVRAHRPDYWLLLLAVGLAAIGMVVVYSISPGLAASQNVAQNFYINKQFISIGAGLIAFFIASQTPLKTFRKARIAFIITAAIGAIAVQVFGEQVNGAYRWIQFGGFSFQSVELIKMALVIYLADLLAFKQNQNAEENWENLLKPLLVILGVVGFVVAFLQSDLGSAGVIAAMVLSMYFLAGADIRRILGVLALILGVTAIAIAGSPYRRERVISFLNPTSNCQEGSYQQCQALIAVGSGGINGLGLGKSVQAYGYTPEAANDSIFAIIAEQFGFIGSFLLLVLYGVFFYRLKKVATNSTDMFAKLLCMGILCWFAVQTVINVGSMLGLLPLKGITLPFISYGGTSLVFVMAATGIVYGASKYTIYQPRVSKSKGINNGYNLAVRRGDRRPHFAPFGRR